MIFWRSCHVLGSTKPTTYYYIWLRVFNNYPGDIILKSNLAAPSRYFKIVAGEELEKKFKQTSEMPVTFGAYDVNNNKKLLVNGLFVLTIKPFASETVLTRIDVTSPEGMFNDQ